MSSRWRRGDDKWSWTERGSGVHHEQLVAMDVVSFCNRGCGVVTYDDGPTGEGSFVGRALGRTWLVVFEVLDLVVRRLLGCAGGNNGGSAGCW